MTLNLCKSDDVEVLKTLFMSSCVQVVNICVWVLASAFGVPATFLGNVEEHENSTPRAHTHTHTHLSVTEDHRLQI